MSKSLTNANYHSNEDIFRKLGVDSSFPVAGVLNDRLWETRLEGVGEGDAESNYHFEAEIGDTAAEKILPNNVFDRFVARTFEQGSYSHDQDLDWYDGLIKIEEDSQKDYFDLDSGIAPSGAVEFLAVPYNSRKNSNSGFDAEDWRVT